MHGRTRNSLVGYGLDTDLIAKIAEHKYTVDMLRSASRPKLADTFTPGEIATIKAKIERAPIPDTVLDEIVRKSGGCCGYCDDGNSSRPYQIHHIVPYSETQDNSEANLLLICPNHHVVVHTNKIAPEKQKSTRWAWYSSVEMALVYQSKGLVFPFGAFVPMDFGLHPVPAELIEFAPLSPSTALICYPKDLAAISLKMLENKGFLLVLGRSGCGKSTYALALGGLLSKAEYAVFRYRFDKLRPNPMKEIFSFVSSCVRKAVVVVDDANAWATADDIQNLARLISKAPNVCLVTTWTNDDSEDASKLSASDVPKQALAWIDLKPAVIDVLLKYEGEIVEALQEYETRNKARPIGIGYLDAHLEDRILALGDKPKTVYEFIFGLRGDEIAVTNEFRQLFDDDRSDLPVLVAAIEQIAGFEQAVTKHEVLQECERIGLLEGMPPPTLDWVSAVLNREVNRRRLVKVRDHFTTIHRKWASKFIAAGLSLANAKQSTQELLRPCFEPSADDPERLLRIWSWLRSVDESRPFVRQWEGSMSQADWVVLVKNSVNKGLSAIGFLANQMHLMREDPTWTNIVGNAFQKNGATITKLIYDASPEDVYSLKYLSRTLAHACPAFWAETLRGWVRQSAARLLVSCRADQFDTAWSTFETARELCPGWLTEVGEHIVWADFQRIITSAEPGDIESICEVFASLPVLKKKVKRSQLRVFAESVGESLRNATLNTIRPPALDTNLLILCLYFPGDAQAAFEKLNAELIGRQLSRSFPRSWRRLSPLAQWADYCESDLARKIIRNTDLIKLEEQVRKYGPANRYELRVLLHFLARGSSESRQILAEKLKDIVTRACEPKDSEAGSIAKAYIRLEPIAGSALAQKLGLEIMENQNENASDKLKQRSLELMKKYREYDAQGFDYDLEIYSGGDQSP